MKTELRSKKYEPGIYHDMPNDEYHAAPGLSKSGMSLILQSPAHYRSRYIDGIGDEETNAMLFGSLFHTATMEPEKLEHQYAVAPEVNRRTKAGKEAWAAFERENKNKNIVTRDDMQCAHEMANSVFCSRVAEALFMGPGAHIEASLFWHDELTGCLLKCRPDCLDVQRRIIVDLKSCQDASPGGFAKACANYGYHIQAAHYMDGVLAVTGVRCNFLFVAVEKKYPYAVGIYELDYEAVETGRILAREAVNRYAECLHRDYWPGYIDRVEKLSLPGWAYR